ncbi:MAG: tRNA preQ1(34) S-adenosylmethionine ribosyltransferase-isomerase QueA [Patescibacteria group bacterium]
MQLELFNYNLPKSLIAQKPATFRDRSRLLVFNKKTNKIKHDYFFNLLNYIDSNDVLVFNNSKVFPARLICNKKTGGTIEVFLLNKINKNNWECLIGGKLGSARELDKNNLKINIIKKLNNGNWQIRFGLTGKKFEIFLNKYGQTPLPPYIKTKDSTIIRKKYQTIYAKYLGSVAAPTAGLHFTKRLLSGLNKKGVQIEFITLHVGVGTFAPVKTARIEQHKIHKEFAVLDKATCARLNLAKKQGKNIIAVGTTSARVLESAIKNKNLKHFNGWVDIFIYPGYKFKFIDAIITNFHLPKSSLLMLVSAFIGKGKVGIKKLMSIYKKAIKKKYRFYSFGDSMFIR